LARGHHEKLNGSGYPYGLEGREIPLAARIFAIVDVWDSLLSERPFREAWPRQIAVAYMEEQAGKHFDPDILVHFLEMISNHK
jgi:HD-GYP domain-containing protein (c-di-GMP phosphodiesterase class II)